MGFLGRKRKDYTEQFETNTNPEEKVTWIKNASQLNILTQWGEALHSIEELFQDTVLYDSSQQPLILKTLNVLKMEWLKIDRGLVTLEEAVTLYDVLHKELPALIYRFGLLKATRASANKNHEEDSLELQEKMEKLMSAVLGVRAKADAQKLSRFKDLHPIPSAHLSRLSWPKYSALPADVDELLVEMGEIWTAQKGNAFTVEDEYLLERIVTDYVPSSIHLWSQFKSGTVEMESTARTALIGQLNLIREHLDKVSETTFREQMKTVNAQTDFLKDRLQK